MNFKNILPWLTAKVEFKKASKYHSRNAKENAIAKTKFNQEVHLQQTVSITILMT